MEKEERFRVVFFLVPPEDGRKREYSVCTLQGESKALDWATRVQTMHHSDEPFFKVEITRLGVGTKEERDADILDRMEW